MTALDEWDGTHYAGCESGETWNPTRRTLSGWLGYEISDDGRLFGPRVERRQQVAPAGHHFVHLYGIPYGRPRSVKVWIHRAVLETFVGPCPIGEECRHLDGNPSNNRLSNLCWGTRLENQGDRERHGTKLLGERAPSAKLTEEDVREIRCLYRTTTIRALGKRFGVSHTVIRRAALGLTWGHLDG